MIVDDPLSETLESTTCRVQEILDDPAHCLVVAVRGNDILGYALAQDYGPSPRRDWSVVRLHVGQPARRGGVGGRLHEAIVMAGQRGLGALLRLSGSRAGLKSDLVEHPFFEVNFTV
jgi:hypothetical protein